MKFYFVVEGNIFLKIWSVFSQIIYIIFRESDFIIKTHISMGVLVSKRLIINSTPWYQRRGISSNLSRPSSLVQESFLTTIKMLKRICYTRRACFRSVEFFLSAVSTGDNNLSNVVPIFRGKLYTRAVRAHWRKFSTLFVLDIWGWNEISIIVWSKHRFQGQKIASSSLWIFPSSRWKRGNSLEKKIIRKFWKIFSNRVILILI